MINQNIDSIAVGKEQFSRYKITDYLTNRAEVAAYLKAAKEENNPTLLSAVMDDIRQIEAMQHKGGSL